MTVSTRRGRRRIRAAYAVRERVQRERAEFTSAYGRATTTQERFYAAAKALFRAVASKKALPNPADAERRVETVTGLLVQLADELLTAQETKADNTIRAEQKRIERRERRRNRECRTHQERPAGPLPAA